MIRACKARILDSSKSAQHEPCYGGEKARLNFPKTLSRPGEGKAKPKFQIGSVGSEEEKLGPTSKRQPYARTKKS